MGLCSHLTDWGRNGLSSCRTKARDLVKVLAEVGKWPYSTVKLVLHLVSNKPVTTRNTKVNKLTQSTNNYWGKDGNFWKSPCGLMKLMLGPFVHYDNL